jgi:UDP-N-acetyl-D-mannosaminuronate dehydrogenase
MRLTFKWYLIGTLIVLVTAFFLFIHLFKKKIFIIGFGYKNDIITVRESKLTLQTVKIDTTNIDSNRVCSFYKTFSYYTFSGNAALNVEIDSANHKLLDTVLIFSEKDKSPFISFEKPTETMFRRKFFVANETFVY